MILKYMYTVFLGVLLATFVGVGIAAFFPSPKQQEYRPTFAPYPATKSISGEEINSTQAARQRLQEQESFIISQQYNQLRQIYNKNVSVIALVCAIIILLISLTLVKNLMYIADGVLLGGVLTLLYSIIRGFDTADNMFRFFVVAVGLCIALFLGYIKFIKPNSMFHSNAQNSK